MKAACFVMALSGLASMADGQSFAPVGHFEDDYGIRYSISPQEWVQWDYARYRIERWDVAGQYLIAQNHAGNPTDPGLWTRIDWMSLEGMTPFEWAFCLTEYRAPTAAAAAAASPADRSTPRTGCNGYPFSRMRAPQAAINPESRATCDTPDGLAINPMTMIPVHLGVLMTLAVALDGGACQPRDAGTAYTTPLARADTVRIGPARFVSHTLTGGAGEATMAMADVTGNGHADLLVLSQEERSLTVFSGDGRGGLIRSGSFPAGDDPTELSVGDLDLDGHSDVLVTNHETDYLTIMWGLSDGSFDGTDRVTISVGPHPHVALIRDVNGDGIPDIVVDHRTGEGLVVILGSGSRQFQTPGDLVPTGGDPYLGFAAADLDGDGLLDMVTPNPRDLGLVFQRPGGWSAPSSLDVGFPPGGVDLGDFNGDGNTDILAVSGESGAGVRVLYSDGASGFRSGELVPMGRGMKKAAVGDLDGDGYDDAIAVSWNGSTVAVRGGPNGMEPFDLSRGGNPWGIVIGDLNHDGQDDFAIADGAEARIKVFVSVR